MPSIGGDKAAEDVVASAVRVGIFKGKDVPNVLHHTERPQVAALILADAAKRLVADGMAFLAKLAVGGQFLEGLDRSKMRSFPWRSMCRAKRNAERRPMPGNRLSA